MSAVLVRSSDGIERYAAPVGRESLDGVGVGAGGQVVQREPSDCGAFAWLGVAGLALPVPRGEEDAEAGVAEVVAVVDEVDELKVVLGEVDADLL
ncbi:hypothetical protein GCM10010411_81550 [Actinomadura fulvescens]|uniref:Uncharacterized protein n=1 Tax=Actinomadura fulvescens TaxID=46160 RepID=A0ABP6CYH8_9ACTN